MAELIENLVILKQCYEACFLLNSPTLEIESPSDNARIDK